MRWARCPASLPLLPRHWCHTNIQDAPQLTSTATFSWLSAVRSAWRPPASEVQQCIAFWRKRQRGQANKRFSQHEARPEAPSALKPTPFLVLLRNMLGSVETVPPQRAHWTQQEDDGTPPPAHHQAPLSRAMSRKLSVARGPELTARMTYTAGLSRIGEALSGESPIQHRSHAIACFIASRSSSPAV